MTFFLSLMIEDAEKQRIWGLLRFGLKRVEGRKKKAKRKLRLCSEKYILALHWTAGHPGATAQTNFWST